jgi:acylphosphatase
MVTRLLRITGIVQGVGFRFALQHEADRRGITGWVRNRSDGSVEAVIQGSAEAVEAITAWARRGPPASRVVDVLASPAPAEHDRPYQRFELRPTA